MFNTGESIMQTQFRRQTWAFDPNYTRVEALDHEGRPLGYVYFIRRPALSRRPLREPSTPSMAALLTFKKALGMSLFKLLSATLS
jgi:hypothetical protein